MKRTALILALSALFVVPAQAAWKLDGEHSSLSFVSVKAVNVAEAHEFHDLSGSLADDGKADIAIGLASVDTNIELRDERMRAMLFETATFATADVSAMVDPDVIEDMEPGDSATMTIEASVSLHGETQTIPMDVIVVRTGDGHLLVCSARQVIVNASQFRLTEGIEKLRAVAGLDSISTAVPVSFVLSFVED